MENIEGTSFSGLKTMQLNDQKAGMEGLDKEVINKIILETSKGTPYFTFQEKRQKSIDSKVQELKLEMENFIESERKKALNKMDLLCQKLEKERDLSHSIVHIDMDGFFAAVEMRDNPELKDKPIAVGSFSMLSTSNYHARKYGVRAAMPGFIAKKLCPDLIIVPCNFDKYRSVSKEMCKIVVQFDPQYSAASLDEVYLDLTEYIKNKHRKKLHEEYCLKNDACDTFTEDENVNNEGVENYTDCMLCAVSISNEARDKMAYDIVQEIRQRIFDVTQLTASAGIAPNTMLAKVCSDQNKPNGQYQINSTLEAVKSFISTLPVKKVSGIGPVQGQILNSIGVFTCADMWFKRDLIAYLFSSNSAEFYMEVALGIGSTTVKSDYIRKSIGNERTFGQIHQPDQLHKKCEELCDDLIEDLKSHNVLGKVIVLKIKTTSFETHTRNYSLKYYTADPEIIYTTAKKLLDTEITAAAPQPLKLRLMGIRMCNLVYEDSISSSEKQQITLKSFLKSKMPLALSPSKSKETFTCPVCLKEFTLTSSLFNNHVNSCLKKPNFCDIETVSTLEDSLQNTDEYEQNDLCISITETTDPEKERINYFCPVCELCPSVENLAELNQHIDRCLNKGTIKEILAGDLQTTVKRKILNTQKGSSKRPKGARKEKKIEEYFQ